MYSIEIYAAFDFLKDETRIGILEYERIKGNSSYRFRFDEHFLAMMPNIKLSSELGYFPGIQSAANGIFDFLGDALPDRWGRALIDKRERIYAEKNNRLPRQFDEFGYLVHIDDITRMGALRFKYNGKYLGLQNDSLNVPHLTSLENFIRVAHEIELAEKKGFFPIREDSINDVWKQGSSLGGARPKANVDINGDLWIAKIPSIKDDYDIALWEHFAATLSQKAGINAIKTELIRVGPTPFHTLLSKRFDRNGQKRIHSASSLTLAGLKDGSGVDNDKGYIDIADVLVGNIGVRHAEDNLSELYRRVAFNILIGNHDDHFRNHGFLLRNDGWELSPAYDVNPTNMLTQSLMISPYSNQSSLKELLKACDYYLINRKTAEEIIRETCLVVENWRSHAKSVGITETEQERFAKRIEYSLSEGHAMFPHKAIVNKPTTKGVKPLKRHKGPSL